MENLSSFYQNHSLTNLCKNAFFLTFFKITLLQHRKAFFPSRIPPNPFSWPILPKISFDQNHRLTPFGEMHFFDFLFIVQNIDKHIFYLILPKRKRWKKIHIFDQNHGLTALGKNAFFSTYFFQDNVSFPQKGFLSVKEKKTTTNKQPNTFSCPIFPKMNM